MGSKLRPINSFYVGIKMEYHFKENDKSICGRAYTVADASIEECASHNYFPAGRKRLGRFFKTGGNSRCVTRRSEFSCRNQFGVNLGVPGLSNRYFDVLVVWRRVDADTIVVTNESVEHNAEDIGKFNSMRIKTTTSDVEQTGNVPSKIWSITTLTRQPQICGLDQTGITCKSDPPRPPSSPTKC